MALCLTDVLCSAPAARNERTKTEKIEAAKVDWKRSYYAEADNSDALRKECEALRKDAERYRWLRSQHWDTAELCVVMDPKDAVKLGRTCPSGEYLDIAVDDAMLIGRAVGAA